MRDQSASVGQIIISIITLIINLIIIRRIILLRRITSKSSRNNAYDSSTLIRCSHTQHTTASATYTSMPSESATIYDATVVVLLQYIYSAGGTTARPTTIFTNWQASFNYMTCVTMSVWSMFTILLPWCYYILFTVNLLHSIDYILFGGAVAPQSPTSALHLGGVIVGSM